MVGIYLMERFFYRVADFMHHWYVHGLRNLTHAFVTFFENLDRTFALKITLKYFFQPLYKDFSFLGRVLGIIFRTFRALIGLSVYLFFALIFIVIYAVWIFFIPALVFVIFENLHGFYLF